MSQRSGSAAVVVYTIMRLGLFLGFWLLVQLVTPLRGLWAAVVALLISGLVSVFLLNRQRTAMGEVVGRFFGGINARIDAASRAEDEQFDDLLDSDSRDPSGGREDRSQGQSQGQRDGVGSDQSTGADEGGNESGPAGTA